MNPLANFSIARLPRIEFGKGAFTKTASFAAQFGQRALLVTGGRSLRATPHWDVLQTALKKNKMSWIDTQVHDEPSPTWVDTITAQLRGEHINVVIGVGGGSVLDAAKAIAGLLRVDHSVMDYLEGVGPELSYEGPSVPLIAVPTTAGTGSEATKNAVLSVRGEAGFKKSFRHELLVPQYAVVDPDLLMTCSPELIAANGMDALTQLVESYVSTKSNVFTDALAWDGIVAACGGLLPWYEQGASAEAARARMGYAALISGITLAQTGLGSVHGLAAPLGAFFPIPHGVVCGTLFATATQANILALRQREPNSVALEKYARIGRLGTGDGKIDDAAACDALVHKLEGWTQQLKLPRLSNYGMTPQDITRVVANCRGSSMKTNPIVLTDAEVATILVERL